MIHARELPPSMRPFSNRRALSSASIFLPRLLIEKLSFLDPSTCAAEKSHALCGIVCGAPREAFSPLFYPFFIWAFGPGKR